MNIADTASFGSMSDVGAKHALQALSKLIDPAYSDYHDVQFCCKDGMVSANKIFLAARSDYFSCLFFGGMREGSTCRANVPCSASALRKVLLYMHTGELPSNGDPWQELCEALFLSQQYLLSDLEEVLMQRITSVASSPSDVAHAISWSLEHGQTSLVKALWLAHFPLTSIQQDSTSSQSSSLLSRAAAGAAAVAAGAPILQGLSQPAVEFLLQQAALYPPETQFWHDLVHWALDAQNSMELAQSQPAAVAAAQATVTSAGAPVPEANATVASALTTTSSIEHDCDASNRDQNAMDASLPQRCCKALNPPTLPPTAVAATATLVPSVAISSSSSAAAAAASAAAALLDPLLPLINWEEISMRQVMELCATEGLGLGQQQLLSIMQLKAAYTERALHPSSMWVSPAPAAFSYR
jgi:hypothetical protein